MGPIVSLVRRQILLGIAGAHPEHWYWQLRGYGARHLAAVERDADAMEAWRAIAEGLQLLFRDPAKARRWMVHPHPQLGARPLDLALNGGEGLRAVRRLLA